MALVFKIQDPLYTIMSVPAMQYLDARAAAGPSAAATAHLPPHRLLPGFGREDGTFTGGGWKVCSHVHATFPYLPVFP